MRASYLLNALAALGVVGILIFGPSESRAAFQLMDASGALSLSNSKEGAAILSGAGLRPGTRSTGSVTIGNPGTDAARLALEVGSESETPGTGGARLWDGLRISIADGSTVLYEGRVADLGRLTLGELGAGSQRTYAITAWLPSGASDNALQGARLSLRFTWLAESVAASVPTPTPTPTAPEPTPTAPPVSPPPVGPVAPTTPSTPTTPPATDPSTTVTAEQLVSMPPAKSCISRRTVRVKIKPPRGVKVKSVAATVNGKKAASAKGAKATITLRGLPRGKVRVQVTATLSTGRKLKLTRTYKTCAR